MLASKERNANRRTNSGSFSHRSMALRMAFICWKMDLCNWKQTSASTMKLGETSFFSASGGPL